MAMTIAKQRHLDNPESFEKLFARGLSYLQQLSGQIWTDYNLHDPGVTILEQLCFALTDLVYRSDFAINDYLTQPDGTIDYPTQGLFAPNVICAAPPLQPEQLKLWLLEKIPELEDIWIENERSDSYRGLYHFECQLESIANQQCLNNPTQKQQIIEKLERCYHSVRGLNEDLGSITIMADTGLILCATIEVSGEQDNETLIAQIYAICGQWIRENSKSFNYNELNEKVLAIPGVLKLSELQLFSYPLTAKSQPLEQIPEHSWLVLPTHQDELKLCLTHHSHPIFSDFHEISLRYWQYQKAHNARQQTRNAPLLPEGQYHQFSDYQSTQNLFPRNYHLSSASLANGQTRITQDAQRHQLRSYLLLFDQLMANFFSDISKLRTLFSTALDDTQSYHYQVLKNEQFTGISQHYVANIDEKLQSLQAQFDNYPERKGRIFDYLLALYGEQFPDDLHLQFNAYFSDDQLQWHLLQLKQRFILNIAPLTANRAIGCNYQDETSQGDYARRLNLLLGMSENSGISSLGANITQHLLNVVSDQQFAKSSIGQETLFNIPNSLSDSLIEVDDIADETHQLTDQKIRQMRAAVVALNAQTIPQSLLQAGVCSQHYKILPRTQSGEYQLYFHFPIDDSDKWLYIGRHRQLAKLVQFCDYFKKWLVKLNRDSEGLYVIEHLALRNLHTLTLEQDKASVENQISIIFPGYTLRHKNPLFRRRAQQIIEQNTPAHLLAHYHWLDFYDFCKFEALYLSWRQNLVHDSTGETTQQIAAQLRALLDSSEANDEELTL